MALYSLVGDLSCRRVNVDLRKLIKTCWVFSRVLYMKPNILGYRATVFESGSYINGVS